jgi:thioesterase domain-containing protein
MTPGAPQPDRSYLVPLRTFGSGAPLFCFLGLGGDVFIFREMVAALREGPPVYGINMEWLCDCRGDFTVEQVAAFCLDVIRTIQGGGPYYLCGYSFGGLVAYEMARRLSDTHYGAGLVALLDTPNPALISNLSKAESVQFRKTYLLDRLKKYGLHLMRGELGSFISRGVAFARSRSGRFFMPSIKRAFRIVNRPLPIKLRANDPGFLKAWNLYVPKNYARDIVCFRVAARGPEHATDPSMGWEACVTGGIRVHVVPGGHVDMMSAPSVRVVADKLSDYLDQASVQATQPVSGLS